MCLYRSEPCIKHHLVVSYLFDSVFSDLYSNVSATLLFTQVCMHFVTHVWNCVLVVVVLGPFYIAGKFLVY